ncbi:transcriptional regulator, GntR family [Thermosyntropha lipolytica DSM 11003]|uniref:Transcriptional regulator, GntR family n=1 Tax=Thermosyntropha lipolytica DSM 11003 TaxID=1123382 RepID=A0A1M5S243_9FIRM|nr:GntR family transcriptional regulator [Thermosyntropha lipolytica]SHH32388.1 transcriptional regulator, GntR family [Thermosyntropha lipolytica DSM 11003]
MHIIISNSSSEPIYEQIVRQLKEMIIQGKLKEDEPLPSIRNLARELKISVITTKRAYQELENEGYIITVPGKGSFVARQNREMLREKYLRIVEEKITEAIEAGRVIDLGLPELQEILRVLYEEG